MSCFQGFEFGSRGIGEPFSGFRGVTYGWEREVNVESTFSEAGRRVRTKVRTRAAKQSQPSDDGWTAVCDGVMGALDPFPEARAAVLAALGPDGATKWVT